MGYILQEPTNFINVKLSDAGRQLLSLGVLTFNKIVLSDREIDYKMGRNNVFDLCDNRVLNVRDVSPNLPSTNFDNTPALTLAANTLGSVRQIVTATTDSTGFFERTGATDNFKIITSTTVNNGCLGVAQVSVNSSNPSLLTFVGYTATTGDLLYIPWEPYEYKSQAHNATNEIPQDLPSVGMWYRVQGVTGGTGTIELDRDAPNFYTAGSIIGRPTNAYFYPYNGMKIKYGESVSDNTRVWNMNITRTTSVIGTNSTMRGYEYYGSIEYAGTKKYLGFNDDVKAFGVIHYTNKFSGNTYAEQFVEKTVELTVPNIMWHRNSTASLVGEELRQGITLYDVAGNSYYDAAAGTSYRELRDTTDLNGLVVGRVYHKLEIFIITDQELLTALSYKTNRNYTLPTPNVSLQSSPSISTPYATPLCQSGKTYFVSYVTTSEEYVNSMDPTLGYPDALQCTSYTAPDIVSDGEMSKFLKVEFPTNSFPFLRNNTNLTALSGSGWSANKVQILVKEIDNNTATTFGDVPTDGWVMMSGSGIYTGETAGETIDPLYLQSKTFILSREDYDSGTEYSLAGTQFDSHTDTSLSGLTFGNEDFFYGNVKAGILSTVYKTVITVYADNASFNSSENSSFDGLLDDSTFITEIGILNNANEIVAVGKPAYPIKKNSSRYLAFQLEIDF